jgi:hypothetical protein
MRGYPRGGPTCPTERCVEQVRWDEFRMPLTCGKLIEAKAGTGAHGLSQLSQPLGHRPHQRDSTPGMGHPRASCRTSLAGAWGGDGGPARPAVAGSGIDQRRGQDIRTAQGSVTACGLPAAEAASRVSRWLRPVRMSTISTIPLGGATWWGLLR